MAIAKKHYIIALKKSFLPDVFGIEKGMVVSRHTEDFKARQLVDKHNARNGVTSSRDPHFGVFSCDLSLAKGEVREDLADKWLADWFDQRAIFCMKCVLDPLWRGGTPIDDSEVAHRLEDLGLSLEDLRARYQDRAQDELDKANAKLLINAERTARLHAIGEDLAVERSQFTYTFPAVAGVQAGRAFYCAQVPLGALVRLFRFDEEDVVPAHMRAQRVLNERRGVAIAEYIVENLGDYVLPAITASVSAQMAFEPYPVSGAANSIGLLHIPMEATLLINDGQHRRYGIEHALKRFPRLAQETIAVTIFYDQGLERSQQMFADINGMQVKPSAAINALYNHRNPFNVWVLDLIDRQPGLRDRIDFENSSVAAKSSKLWSLVAFKKAISLLTGVSEKTIVDIADEQLSEIADFVVRFFDECSKWIPDWRQMITGRIPACEVRELFVIGHAVWLEALAIFARHALFSGQGLQQGDASVKPASASWDVLKALEKVDTRRVSRMWDGRCVVLGKMQKTSDGVHSTAARLLKVANVPLPEQMRELERRLAA